MSIAAFIRDRVLRPRLLEAGCLVVYDPDGRFRDICIGLNDGRARIIDASLSSMESRQAAMMTAP